MIKLDLPTANQMTTETITIFDNNGKDTLMMWFLIILLLFILYMTAFLAYDIWQENKKERLRNQGKEDNTKTVLWKCKEWFLFCLRIAVPVLCAYVILSNVVLVTRVASGSMEPKLHVGNTAVYSRLLYKNSVPQRGDIISFLSSKDNKILAKRVIGLPGDTVEFKNGHVYINGIITDETEYIGDNIETNSIKTFTVPDRCVFVLGDNRENSNDSRFWEQPYISFDSIYGKYIGGLPFGLPIFNPGVAWK